MGSPRFEAKVVAPFVLAAMVLVIALFASLPHSTPRPPAPARPVGVGNGTFYDAAAGQIVVGGGRSAEEIALALAHEATHARYAKEGRAAQVAVEARSESVRKMLDEEAEAIAGSIEVKKELANAGKNIHARYPLEAEYEAAYEAAVRDLERTNAAATLEERAAAGKAAGLEAVRTGFATGKVVTVDTAEKVTDYYGRIWDERHRAKEQRNADDE